MDRRCCSRRIFFSRNRRWYSRFLILLRSSSLIYSLLKCEFQESEPFGGLSAGLARLQRAAGNASWGRRLAAFDAGSGMYAMV